MDFPPASQNPALQPCVRHEHLEVTTLQDIVSEPDYLEELAKFNEEATRHENRMIQEYMNSRVEWILWKDASDKLENLNLLRETSGPLCLFYESQNDGQLELDDVKKRRLNVFTGVGAGASATWLNVFC